MIKLTNISKKFPNKIIFNELTLDIPKKSFTCITGPSGSGKTTLLNILGLLEKPDSGTISFNNKEISSKDILLLQRNQIGYLFQNYGLIDNETTEKNLLVAMEYKKYPLSKKKQLIKESLKKVFLSTDILSKKVYQLSGGEQQRVALCRLILKEAEYILADEPTGNLDNYNRDIVFEILTELNAKGATVIFVTHDTTLVNQAKTVINLPINLN